MTETAEAIIVGAGVQGASLAFHLAERGMRPLVLERATVAAGATGRSSGVVRMHYDVEAEARLAWRSHALLLRLGTADRRRFGLHRGRLPADGATGGITPDQHPIIGPAGPDGFWLDCGFSGTGFKTAPAIGASLAQLITEGPTANDDLAIYRPERFAAGEPIVGEHAYADIWR